MTFTNCMRESVWVPFYILYPVFSALCDLFLSLVLYFNLTGRLTSSSVTSPGPPSKFSLSLLFRWLQRLNRDQPRWGHVSSDPSLSHQPVISSRSGAGIAAIFVSIQPVILEPCEPQLWMTKTGMRCQCVCVCVSEGSNTCQHQSQDCNPETSWHTHTNSCVLTPI